MERLYSVLLSILVTQCPLLDALAVMIQKIQTTTTRIVLEIMKPQFCLKETNLENARMELTTTEMVYSIVTTLIIAGSAVCKVNEENNTNQNDSGSTEDVYSEFDDHKIVNLTNGIISSGYFDEADCNFVLFAKDWDENSIS